MRIFVALSLLSLMSPTAQASEKPLPEGIQIIPADQASKCTFIDVVTAMKFATVSASKTSRAALIAALEKAKAKGANSAVIMATSVNNNQHQYTLSAYRCDGFPPSRE